MNHPVHQLFFDRLVHHQVIRCNTGLSGIDKFPGNNPFCRYFDIGVLINNTRTFTAQLQGDRRQVLCGSCHNNFSYCRTAGKENIIKFLR